jgi:RecA-family ATPase
LASLLLVPTHWDDLPEEFTSTDFETSDYRDVYERMYSDIREGKPVGMAELNARYPEIRSLITDITFAVVPLNGTFRLKAQSLMSHRPVTEKEEFQTKPAETPTESDKFRFEVFNGLEIVKMDIPEQSFLIKNLLSDNSVNFLSGEEGCGKSLLAMNLAVSVATGATRWLEFEVMKPGKVLYLNNELAFSDFSRRLKAMGNNLPAPGDLSNLIVPKEVPALSECWETLNELCEQERPVLGVVDCLYFTHDRDENDSSQMKALMRQFISLRDRYNLALLLIHHTKKGARYEKMHNDQMRGSNVFGGVTDTVLQVRRSATDEGKRILKPTKFRHVSDENRKCRLLSLNPESLWFRDEGEVDEGAHIATMGQTAEQEIDFVSVFSDAKELTRKEIQARCKSLGYAERTVDRLLKKAVEAGIMRLQSYGKYSL